MVGRLVHQQDVRFQHQRPDDGQSFLPSSGERGRGLVCCGKLSQTERRRHAIAMVVGVQTFVDQDLGEHFLDRLRPVK
jgi:hypothetical protein